MEGDNLDTHTAAETADAVRTIPLDRAPRDSHRDCGSDMSRYFVHVVWDVSCTLGPRLRVAEDRASLCCHDDLIWEYVVVEEWSDGVCVAGDWLVSWLLCSVPGGICITSLA